jgi:hypothetical protein
VLYVGGAFTDAGGNASADFIASWNGTKWAALGASTLNGGVFAVAYYNGKVYAGGVFTNAGGNPNADFLAVWDGTSWGQVCKRRAPIGEASLLQVIGSTLYVGGAFQNGAPLRLPTTCCCDLNTGAPRSTVAADGDFSGAVYALTADSNGVLYAGGGFINLARIPLPTTSRTSTAPAGMRWALGGARQRRRSDFVRSLAASGTDVYVGTDSTNVAGIAQADHVVKWNGSAWSALSANTAGTDGWFPTSASINSLTTSGAGVYAGGNFQNANGDPVADQIAYFDGTAWHPVGSNGAGNGPLDGNVTALEPSAGRSTQAEASRAPAEHARELRRLLQSRRRDPGGPPSGTPTGTVLVNGAPFTGGPSPSARRST